MNLKKQAKIIEIMQRKNPISVKDLSIELECTEMTVRRNLDQMQEKGLLKREHGYAYLLDATKVTDYYAEENEHVKEKEVIASLAVRFIKTGMGICLDSGTTIQKLVDIIPDHYELRHHAQPDRCLCSSEKKTDSGVNARWFSASCKPFPSAG